MKPYLYVMAATLLTICCWGVYGPLLHKGQAAMEGSRLRPLICVGLAYFVIAVALPGILLAAQVESGHRWTTTGVLWSLAGGAAGALGALGIILAFYFNGKPSYVMPLVFGCAPAVNAFLTIYMARAWGEVGPFFLAGLIILTIGAMMVLVFAPKPHGPPKPATTVAAAEPAGAQP